MSNLNKGTNSIKNDKVDWKWILLTILIIYSANFFSGFIISSSLNIAGLDASQSYIKIAYFLTLISYFIPFLFITIITLVQKFNWKHIFYISIIFIILGFLENFFIGQKTLTLVGMVINFVSTLIIFALGKLFADIILKVYKKFFEKSN